MSGRPRVLLADDHTMVRAAFEQLLRPACDVVGTVADGRALLELAPRLRPDVIVADISMPLLNGLDACRQLRGQLPATRWVILTVHEDPDFALEAFEAGASAYLLKSSAAQELFDAIQAVMRGARHVTPLIGRGASVAEFLARAPGPHRQGHGHGPDHQLTERQREVLQLLAEGRAMKEVAGILGVSTRTVAYHKYAIMKRVGAHSSAALVQHAVRLGLVSP